MYDEHFRRLERHVDKPPQFHILEGKLAQQREFEPHPHRRDNTLTGRRLQQSDQGMVFTQDGTSERFQLHGEVHRFVTLPAREVSGKVHIAQPYNHK